MAEQLANDIQTLLAADLTAGETKLKPLSAVGFPPAEFRIRIDDELMLVTALGAEWTITRGVEGTAAAAHEAGSTIYHLLTRGSLLRILEEFAQPLDADLSAVAALSTTPFGRGLLALASASAGRSAFELGSAAQQPSSAFDLAGAAAAAQAASQPLDADLTAIAALSTTPIGRSLLGALSAAGIRSISEAAAAVHAAQHQLGGADPLALPQYDPFDLLPYVVPMGYPAGTTTTLTAKRGYHNRFTVARKREFKFVRFGVAVVGTGAEEKWDVAIWKLNGAKFERLASSGYKPVNMTSLGPKAVEMTSAAVCEPGVVHFVSAQPETVSGTPQIVAVISNNANVGDIAGTGTVGNRIFLIRTETGAFPATLEGGFSGSQNPWLVPSES